MAAASWARGGWRAAGRSFSSGAHDASAVSAGQNYVSLEGDAVPGDAGAAAAGVPGEPSPACHTSKHA